MKKEIIHTLHAPQAIGTYSQAVRYGDTVYISGQIPLDPATGEMVVGDFKTQTRRVFQNLLAICEAAGGSLQHILKLNIYLIDLAHFAAVNEVMAEFIGTPYPARAALGVAQLPKDAAIEIEAIMGINNQ